MINRKLSHISLSTVDICSYLVPKKAGCDNGRDQEVFLERITFELSSDFFLEAISYGVLRHDLDPSSMLSAKNSQS